MWHYTVQGEYKRVPVQLWLIFQQCVRIFILTPSTLNAKPTDDDVDYNVISLTMSYLPCWIPINNPTRPTSIGENILNTKLSHVFDVLFKYQFSDVCCDIDVIVARAFRSFVHRRRLSDVSSRQLLPFVYWCGRRWELYVYYLVASLFSLPRLFYRAFVSVCM